MNELFVNIKVDREERPDLDEIYMNAVQMLTGRGGWPMTHVSDAGSQALLWRHLFPAGRPSAACRAFRGYSWEFLRPIANVPQDVEKSVTQILGALQRMAESQETTKDFSKTIIAEGAAIRSPALTTPITAVWAKRPSFPMPASMSSSYAIIHRSKSSRYLEMVAHTLTKMARGGIYDHLGGGFHRYSVDAKWLVPHFEKMLYDNGQLVRIYAMLHGNPGTAVQSGRRRNCDLSAARNASA